jgi:hypothetical protein
VDYFIIIIYLILMVILLFQNFKISELKASRSEHLRQLTDDFKAKYPEIHVIRPKRGPDFDRYYQFINKKGDMCLRLVNSSTFGEDVGVMEILKNNHYSYECRYFSPSEMPKIYNLID